MIAKTPLVFISYSWTSVEYQSQIIGIAAQLRHDGVDVKLDVWDLKTGHDKYAYMEQCVTDNNIDRVLIFCDKKYAEKANLRQGGVGDETTIISPEVYGKVSQDKMIPIVMERDSNGNTFLPAYLRTLKYVDLTGDNFKSGYEELLRIIFEQPAKRKPELGTPPSWLTEDETTELYSIKQFTNFAVDRKLGNLDNTIVRSFLDKYVEAMKPFYKGAYERHEQYLDDFAKMQEYRDAFLDFLQSLAGSPHLGSYMADFFERLYNSLYNKFTFVANPSSCYGNEFDIFRIHIWELFICTIAYMLRFELFESINELLVHTYYLKNSALGLEENESSYKGFYFTSEMLEYNIKPNLDTNLRKYFSITGYFICEKGEYKPIYSGRSIANADLFLFQVYNGLSLGDLYDGYPWFPQLYVYSDGNYNFWKRLKSEQFCKKIMPIFGVYTVVELKDRIAKCKHLNDYKYSGSLKSAIAILDCVKLDQIATLP